MRHGIIVLVVMITGCSFAATTAQGGGGGGPSDGTGKFTVPNLFGMQKDAALAELKRLGHAGTVSDDSSLCGSVVEGRIIELGEVCYQHPAPGQAMGVRLPMSLRVQTEDPRHGRIGEHTEWHLMPDVVGMPLEDAKRVLREHGFTTEDRTKISQVDEAGCAAGTVCRTYPETNNRGGLHSDRVLYVGAE